MTLLLSCALEKSNVKQEEFKRDFYIYPHTVIPSLVSIEREAAIFFEDELFADLYSKSRWLDRLGSFYRGYRSSFSRITFLKDREPGYEVLFYLKNGDRFYFADGKILPQDKLDRAGHYLPLFYKYCLKEGESADNYHYGPFNYDLFYSLYGKNRLEIYNNLIFVKVFGRRVRFNRMNGAAERLKAAVAKVEELAKSDQEVVKWLASIGSISAYSPREVANEPKVSLHSFAIAIDILPRNNRKQIYWFWSAYFYPEWWDIPHSERVIIPGQVVAIFEEEGFVWGGKWTKFDNMHFEYRPEILEQKLQ